MSANNKNELVNEPAASSMPVVKNPLLTQPYQFGHPPLTPTLQAPMPIAIASTTSTETESSILEDVLIGVGLIGLGAGIAALAYFLSDSESQPEKLTATTPPSPTMDEEVVIDQESLVHELTVRHNQRVAELLKAMTSNAGGALSYKDNTFSASFTEHAFDVQKGCLQSHLHITGLDDDLLWRQRNEWEEELQKLIRNVIREEAGEDISVGEIRVTRGTIGIDLPIWIAAGVKIKLMVAGFLAAHPTIRAGVHKVAHWVHQKIVEQLLDLVLKLAVKIVEIIENCLRKLVTTIVTFFRGRRQQMLPA